MKKILLVFVSMFFALNSFSQVQTNQVSRDAYLTKSKKQNRTGLVLVAGGVVLVATGFIIPKGDPTGEINWIDISPKYKNDEIKVAFSMAGLVAALGSIPFFVASNKNKKRAMKTSVSFISQEIHYLQRNSVAVRLQPGLSFKLGW